MKKKQVDFFFFFFTCGAIYDFEHHISLRKNYRLLCRSFLRLDGLQQDVEERVVAQLHATVRVPEVHEEDDDDRQDAVGQVRLHHRRDDQHDQHADQEVGADGENTDNRQSRQEKQEDFK